MRINGYDDLSTDDAKELFRTTFNEAVSKKSGMFDIDNPCEGYGITWSNALNQSLKKDIFNGCVTCRKGQAKNFKESSPFTIAKTTMSFTHGYDTDEEMLERISEKNAPIFFNFGGKGNPTLLKFRLNLGANPKNKNELVSVIKKVFTGEYEYAGSSIQISGNKIILNLTLKIPKSDDILKTLKKDVVVGLSLGMNTALIGTLNTGKKVFTYGTESELEFYRNYIQREYRDLKKALKGNNGGHGRKKKLKKLEDYQDRERNYVQTFNHRAALGVINFAIKNHASLIRMPDLTKIKDEVAKSTEEKDKNEDINKYILRNWSYYQLQNYIEDLASRVGITIEYVELPDNDPEKSATSDIQVALKLAQM